VIEKIKMKNLLKVQKKVGSGYFGWNGSVEEMEVVMMMSGCKHGCFNSSHRLQQEHRSKEATAKRRGWRLARILSSSLLLVCISIFPLMALTDFMLRGQISMGEFFPNLNL